MHLSAPGALGRPRARWPVRIGTYACQGCSTAALPRVPPSRRASAAGRRSRCAAPRRARARAPAAPRRDAACGRRGASPPPGPPARWVAGLVVDTGSVRGAVWGAGAGGGGGGAERASRLKSSGGECVRSGALSACLPPRALQPCTMPPERHLALNGPRRAVSISPGGPSPELGCTSAPAPPRGPTASSLMQA